MRAALTVPHEPIYVIGNLCASGREIPNKLQYEAGHRRLTSGVSSLDRPRCVSGRSHSPVTQSRSVLSRAEFFVVRLQVRLLQQALAAMLGRPTGFMV